ncbi:MAG: VCBS repeat-containing protein [Candidatus Peribacteraceae bacterium]|nr:VCBS repeat-containing protein [Candidatus Peribacteraceae bacterium]
MLHFSEFPLFLLKRNTIIGFALIVLLAAMLTLAGPLLIKGDILPRDIGLKMKALADTDTNSVLTVREIRKALVKVIGGVSVQDAAFDVNESGVVNRADLADAISAFRGLLSAVCGNGTVDTGEQCDDGGGTDGNGCSAVCSIESRFTCEGEPSSCFFLPICGNGLREPEETCDDGNAVAGDGCSAQRIGSGFKADAYVDSGMQPGHVHRPSITVADFNGDGVPDLASTNESSSFHVWIGKGNGTFNPKVSYVTGGANTSVVASGDLNGDSKPDIVVGTQAPESLQVFMNNGDGTFGSGVAYPTDLPSAIAIGDHNGDGKPDLAVTNYNAGKLSIFVNGGNGQFTFEVARISGNQPTSVVSGDFNGDQKLDYAVTSNFSRITIVIPHDALYDNAVSVHTLPVQNWFPAFVAAADLNNDQKLDLVVSDHHNSTISVFFGKGDGTFLPRTSYLTGDSPIFVSIGDVDGDGIADIVTANRYGDGDVSIHIGKVDGTFEYAYEVVTGPNPVWITMADLNLDQREDIIVGTGTGTSILFNMPVCSIEEGFQCSGSPSVCSTTCGNGVKEGMERCDDGNTASSDGCSSVCREETGYACNDASPSQCTCANARCGNNDVTVIDSEGTVGQHSVIAIGTDGFPIIMYGDNDNNLLKVVKCATAGCTVGNVITTIDTQSAWNSFTQSIVIAPDGRPTMAYTRGLSSVLKYARCGNESCTSGNIVKEIDGPDMGNFISMVFGSDGLPVIAYQDDTRRNEGIRSLKVAHCSDIECSTASQVIVDQGGDRGWYPSIAIGTNGLPIVSYRDMGNNSLKIVFCANVGCVGSTVSRVLDTGRAGFYTSLAIGTDGNPIMSYVDDTLAKTKVLHCRNPECTGTSDITAIGETAGDTSIAIGADGRPIVSFWEPNQFVIMKCGNVACTAGNEKVVIEQTSQFSNDSSITIGTDGLPVASYQDNIEGDLKVIRCTTPSCK